MSQSTEMKGFERVCEVGFQVSAESAGPEVKDFCLDYPHDLFQSITFAICPTCNFF